MKMSEASYLTPERLRGKLRNRVDMGRHTSWRAGGIADYLYQPADLDDLLVYLREFKTASPLLPLGLGSNLLVRDGGFGGTVLLLHAALSELRLEQDGTLYAQAGVPGAKLARFAASHNLRGAEFFAGIPGTVGGMLTMNAGCYGSETWNVVARVLTIDQQGVLHERHPAEYDVAYRHLLRKKVSASEPGIVDSGMVSIQDDEIFVAAWFKLQAGDGDISRSEIKTLLKKRIVSQPLNLPNAGSVFRNPPHDHAARLIEVSGLKGKTVGGAQVSMKHTNFIVNLGNATATDIENLIVEVQEQVRQKTGVVLHPEVRIVGEAIKSANAG
jgi:UDP-N-acetylenolpyruvoylglucosamine reductase